MQNPKKRPQTECAPSKSFDDDIFLQPWYVPRDVYLQIRRLLPNIHLSKMRYYFEDYGCLKCGQRTSLYGSNGLCERCTVLVRGRVVRALERRLKDVGEIKRTPNLSDSVGDGTMAAQNLLQSLKGHNKHPQALFEKEPRKRSPRGRVISA